jgi:hypothetical protein
MATKLNAQWIVGFVDGEGYFGASVIKNNEMKFKIQIQMEFVVTQHKRDIQLMQSLKSYFKCGHISTLKAEEQTNCVRWRVRDITHIVEIIIPFFEKHKLKTKKGIEFQRFRRLSLLLKEKTHLTEEGFNRCLKAAKEISFDKNVQRLLEMPENELELKTYTPINSSAR